MRNVVGERIYKGRDQPSTNESNFRGPSPGAARSYSPQRDVCFRPAGARFLEFVVEQTLAAQQDYIKESVIGSEVFGREPGYDPRAHAIVRVEATKLRSRLSKKSRGPRALRPLQLEF